MNEFRATLAIVRRHIDRRFALDWGLQFALVGGIAYVFSPLLPQPFFGIAISSALAAASAGERSHAAGLRRVTFFAMPLYGRQLARAHAVAPVLAALAIPIGYATGSALRGHPAGLETVALYVVAALVATLIALSSIFRDGYAAWLYLLLAAFIGAAIGDIPISLSNSEAFPLAVAVAALTGFLALRAFGETLARYDPLPP